MSARWRMSARAARWPAIAAAMAPSAFIGWAGSGTAVASAVSAAILVPALALLAPLRVSRRRFASSLAASSLSEPRQQSTSQVRSRRQQGTLRRRGIADGARALICRWRQAASNIGNGTGTRWTGCRRAGTCVDRSGSIDCRSERAAVRMTNISKTGSRLKFQTLFVGTRTAVIRHQFQTRARDGPGE